MVREFGSAYEFAFLQVLRLRSKFDNSLDQGEAEPFEPDKVKIFMFAGVHKIPAEEATT